MDEQRILVIPGSVRRGGLNAALAQFASGKARSLGLQVAQMDLRALELPVYDGDLEASSGVPQERTSCGTPSPTVTACSW